MIATAPEVLLDVERRTSSPELNAPHEAGSAIAGQFQRCTACGEVLVSAIDDDDEAPNFYAPGSRVGTDCWGRIATRATDRLTHHAEIISIDGEPYRKRETEQAQKRKQEQKPKR